MPPYLGPVCDRFVFRALQQMDLKLAWCDKPSVVFTAHYSWAYEALNREPPADVHDIDWDQIKARFVAEEVFDRTGIESWIVNSEQ